MTTSEVLQILSDNDNAAYKRWLDNEPNTFGAGFERGSYNAFQIAAALVRLITEAQGDDA